jgi:hypothetical protein
MAREQFNRKNLSRGQAVFLQPERLRVFAEKDQEDSVDTAA